MPESGPYNIASTYLRLRPDATVEPLAVDEQFWQRLIEGRLGRFHNEFMVSLLTFETDWTMWEMHPRGDEIVCLLSGAVAFVLEREDGTETIDLETSGDFLVVPQGTWHTATVSEPARMLFITAGEDTQHRPIS